MKKLVTSVALVSALFATTYHYGYKDFSLFKEYNIFGNSETIGNTIECVTNLKRVRNLNELKFVRCSNDINKINNKYMTKYVNVLGTDFIDSSTANLKLPSTFKKIIWAMIVWQGHVNNYSYQKSNTSRTKNGYDKYYITQSRDHKSIYKYIDSRGNPYFDLSNDLPNNQANDIKNIGANKIKLKIGSFPIEDIEADELYYKSDSRRFKNLKTGRYETKRGVKYSAYKILPQSVIDKLNQLAIPNGEIPITVANIKSTIGLDRRLGDYGAWSLVVVYEEDKNNVNSKFRNNSIYYGFKSIYGGYEADININDLLLPLNGRINSQLSVFTAEGEYQNRGDTVTINGELPQENVENFDPHNVFDGRLSNDISRNPFLINNNGIDIDVFDIGDILTHTRNRTNRSRNNVNIHIKSPHDGVFVSTLAFATELYEPRVCYYIDTIKDDNGNIIYQNRHFIRPINPTKNYEIDLWIANMKKNSSDYVEEARNVKVYEKFNNFDYLNNSFYMKNVAERYFSHLTDDRLDDLGEYLSSNKEFDFRIGRGALLERGGVLPPYNSNNANKVYVKFKGKFNANEGYINLDDFISLYTTFSTPFVTIDNPIPMPKCVDFETRARVFIPPAGLFNVVHYNPSISYDPLDVNNSINALYTQIAGKDFNVTVVKLADDNQTLQNYTGYVELDLIKAPRDVNECKTLPSVIPPIFVKFNNETKKNVNLVVNNAYKDLRFRVRYLDNDSDGCLVNTLRDIASGNFYPSIMNCSSCVNECMSGIDSCLRCIFGSSNVKSVCSRDDFAIRPYKFEITLPSKAKAGDEINATIKALDYNGNVVTNYEEILSLNSSPKLTVNDKNPLAYESNLSLVSINNAFINGVAKVMLTYPEVGDIEINVSEVNGSEFAKVDNKDTNDRFIKASSKELKVIPYRFDVVSNFSNYNGGSFTYISNDLNMAAPLSLTIKALNKQGNITKNFSSNLYAKDVNITINHNLVNNLISNVNFVEKNSTSDVYTINQSNFSNGESSVNILYNIRRDYRRAVEPVDLNISNIEVSDVDNDNVVNLNRGARFIYGKIRVSDATSYSNEANSSVEYLYYENASWHINTNHTSAYGDINLTKSIYPSNVTITPSTINDGRELLSITTTHSLPYSVKIHYSIPSYLWQHPLAKPYKDPSSTNLDCLTHPCSTIEFKADKTGWGGVGKSGIKYSETNRTSEVNSSKNVMKANKKDVFKIDW